MNAFLGLVPVRSGGFPGQAGLKAHEKWARSAPLRRTPGSRLWACGVRCLRTAADVAHRRTGTGIQGGVDHMTSTQGDTRDLSALGGLLAGAGFFGGVAAAKATEKSPYPRPGCEPEEVQQYFKDSAKAARLSAAGLALSSAGLAVFTASVASLAGQSRHGSRALQ